LHTIKYSIKSNGKKFLSYRKELQSYRKEPQSYRKEPQSYRKELQLYRKELKTIGKKNCQYEKALICKEKILLNCLRLKNN